MELVREFTFHAGLGETLRIGRGPFGHRSVGIVGDGWVKGDRINGQLVGPGADWVIVGGDGYGQIDVRAQIRTDDGANIYISYNGSIEMSESLNTALFSDGETRFGDQYWCTHVRLESGAPDYAWVNRTMFVGQGRVAADGAEYEVYRLA